MVSDLYSRKENSVDVVDLVVHPIVYFVVSVRIVDEVEEQNLESLEFGWLVHGFLLLMISVMVMMVMDSGLSQALGIVRR